MSHSRPLDPSLDSVPPRAGEGAAAPIIGERVHNYEIVSTIGEGGMGTLYLQARCYEQNGQYRQAAGRYREFLHKLALLYWRWASVRSGGQQARVRMVPTLAADGLGGLLAVSY